jgi:hypothetical protein
MGSLAGNVASSAWSRSHSRCALLISLAVLAIKRIDLAAVQPDVLKRAVAQRAQLVAGALGVPRGMDPEPALP